VSARFHLSQEEHPRVQVQATLEKTILGRLINKSRTGKSAECAVCRLPSQQKLSACYSHSTSLQFPWRSELPKCSKQRQVIRDLHSAGHLSLPNFRRNPDWIFHRRSLPSMELSRLRHLFRHKLSEPCSSMHRINNFNFPIFRKHYMYEM
jgi:hypothetical protein